MLPVETPFKIYTGLDGKPLDGGFVYFGQPGLNPITAPVTVYWDAAGTQPAAQPIRTENGYMVRAPGTPANVFFDGPYSQLVQDKQKRQVFYARTSDDFSIATQVSNFKTSLASAIGSTLVGYANGGTPMTVEQMFDMLYYGIANVMNKRYAGGAKCDGVTDDTAAVQGALNASPIVYFPGLCLVTADLSVTKPYAILLGNGKYSGSGIMRTGSGPGAVLTFGVNTVYPTMRGMYVRWVPTTSTDYFNTGTVGIDITSANTSIDMQDNWVRGCETSVKSNYNGFYNNFENNRFEETLTALYGMAINGLNVVNNRFKGFNDAMLCSGEGGTLRVAGNRFEVFNGHILNVAGDNQGSYTVENNYVEIYDNLDLPTNFPQAANAKPGKFGGNVLFSGPFGTLKLLNNELKIGGAYIIASLAKCDHFESSNNIHLYDAGNNLLRLYNLPTLKSCSVKDRIGVSVGASGGYTVTYDQATNVPLLDSPYGEFDFYDAVLNQHLLCPTQKYVPTLSAGWSTSGPPDGVPAVIYDKKGLFLQGEVTGTAVAAGSVIFNLPPGQRPPVFSTNRGYCFLATTSDEGAGVTVQLRYLYGTGDFRLENTPSSTNNIVLDGLFIPAQI